MHLIERVYRRSFEAAFRKVGLHEYINDLYWKYNLFHIMGYRVLGTSFLNCEYLHNEEFVVADLYNELKDGDTFYDVGANFGQYSLLVLNHPSDVDVVSFEPFPDNFEILKYNVARNGYCKRCKSFDVALHHDSGNVQMSGQNKIAKINGGNPNNSRSVRARIGDEFIHQNQLEKPTILKMDIEGNELNALHGLRNNLVRKQLRTIYIEIHANKLSKKNQSSKQVKKLLTNCGFALNNIGHEEGREFLKGTKNTNAGH